eukprot:4490942-Ditylum_brightwellii.AAC.1
MYYVEVVEGKDRPHKLSKQYFHKEGGTAALLLHMTKNIFGLGKMVILDSDFCVLQAMIALKRCAVFASAFIKKRCYWPKYVNGPGIQPFFEDKAIGHQSRLPGVLDGV